MDAPVNVLEPLLLLCLRNFRAAGAGTNLSVEFLFKNLREGFQGVGMIFSRKHGCLAYVARPQAVICSCPWIPVTGSAVLKSPVH